MRFFARRLTHILCAKLRQFHCCVVTLTPLRALKGRKTRHFTLTAICFTFRALPPSDDRSRLLISAWNQNPKRGCSDFIGCLSFGIRHLQSKCRHAGVVSGWYYLLSAELGHRKHIRNGRESGNDVDVDDDDVSENKENCVSELTTVCMHADLLTLSNGFDKWFYLSYLWIKSFMLRLYSFRLH